MKSAVLVIDTQVGLFAGTPGPYLATDVISKINHITSSARDADIPVIFIQHEQNTGLLVYSSEDWKLLPSLIVNEKDILVRKTTPDSFLRTDLEEILTVKRITNLLICGYATEFCVDTTVRRAAALGFTVQLLADGHTTHDKQHATAIAIREHHNQTLPNISSFGPKITAVKTEEIIFKG